ncbi:MAG: GNAT family N-acetyltransferase [Spirochaetaceae bacterium]|nr:GNAT family N-acetyltransferase [Spirochaetaceae bacterium]
MFELTDTILERIIFAMEDQSKAYFVDCADGELVSKAELLDADGEKIDRLVPPPEWSSADGFRMMELFAASTRNPELKAEFSQALCRGKKVFKTFKEILSKWPNAEKSFLDFKARYMRQRIQDWLNEIREANGLMRLPDEPEETQDLLLTDFLVSIAPFAELPFEVEPIIDADCLENRNSLPPALISMERESLLDLIHGQDSEATGLGAWIEDERSLPIGLILGVMENHEGHAMGRIRFVFVQEGYRDLGIASLLLDRLTASFAEKGVFAIYLDSLLVPAEYEERFQAIGFGSVGVHSFHQAD